jgi:hypothetical protein
MDKIKIVTKAPEAALTRTLKAFENIEGVEVTAFPERVRLKIEAAQVDRTAVEKGFREAPEVAESIWAEMRRRDVWMSGQGEILAFQFAGEVPYAGEEMDADQIVESLSARICGRV